VGLYSTLEGHPLGSTMPEHHPDDCPAEAGESQTHNPMGSVLFEVVPTGRPSRAATAQDCPGKRMARMVVDCLNFAQRITLWFATFEARAHLLGRCGWVLN